MLSSEFWGKGKYASCHYYSYTTLGWNLKPGQLRKGNKRHTDRKGRKPAPICR